jgi:hypothetical protein
MDVKPSFLQVHLWSIAANLQISVFVFVVPTARVSFQLADSRVLTIAEFTAGGHQLT